MLSVEFYRNYNEIKKAFPGYKVLTVNKMAAYLGITPRSLKNSFGITEKLTVESFAARLSERGKT